METPPLPLAAWFDFLARSVASDLGQPLDDRTTQLSLSERKDRKFALRLMRSVQMRAAAVAPDRIKPYHGVVSDLLGQVELKKLLARSLRGEQKQLNTRTHERLWIMSLIRLKVSRQVAYSSPIKIALKRHRWHMTPDAIKERVSRFRAGLLARAQAEDSSLAELKFGILRFHFEEFKGAEHWKVNRRKYDRIRRENPNATDARLFRKLKTVLPRFQVRDSMITTLGTDEIRAIGKLAGLKSLRGRPLQSTRVRFRRPARRAVKPQ